MGQSQHSDEWLVRVWGGRTRCGGRCEWSSYTWNTVLYGTLYIVHSILYTLYWKLFTLNFILYTIHFTRCGHQYTVQCLLKTVYTCVHVWVILRYPLTETAFESVTHGWVERSLYTCITVLDQCAVEAGKINFSYTICKSLFNHFHIYGQ